MASPRDNIDKKSRRDNISDFKDNVGQNSTIVDKYAYKYFGEFVSGYKNFTSEYQSVLQSAQISVSADLYVSRIILYTIIISVLTFISGLLLTGIIALNSGLFNGAMGVLILIFIPFILSIFVGSISGIILYFWPSYVASRRSSKINNTLPSAVTYMYALNRGGINIVEVFRKLGENEEVYGEVSREVGSIVQDIDYFSRNLPTSLERARDRSPSQKFRDFMDDMVSTIDSGGDMEKFLKEKSDELMEESKREQENFIQTLGLLGEVYVTAFVAGPLFMIIITVIMSVLGGANPTQLDGIVYGLLPIMNICYFFLINILSGVNTETASEIPYDTSNSSEYDIEEYAEKTNNKSVQKVAKAKSRRNRTEILKNPIKFLLDNPNKSTYFTLPLVFLYYITILLIGTRLSLSAFIDSPVIYTLYWILIPIFIVSVPLSVLYEIGSKRKSRVTNRLPETLRNLASANQVGMTLTEAVENTAENTTGRLGDELQKVKNDVRWNHNINVSLIKFANRMKVPTLTRTINLISEANSSTGDVEEVISIAAKNVGTRIQLDKERSSSMFMYTAVILISFFVYLFVVGLLDLMFLSTITGTEGSDLSGSPNDVGFDVSKLPVERFRLVFYHSTIVQAFGSGMIAGYLSSNDVRAGLKYAITLCIVATIVFAIL